MHGAILYLGEGIPPNKPESSVYFKRAADQGHIESIVKYANMLYEGVEIGINKKESSVYFKLAANQGLAESIFQTCS